MELTYLKPGQTEAQERFGGSMHKISNPLLVRGPGLYPVAWDHDKREVKIVWDAHLGMEANALQFHRWITERGGVACWQSQDLSSGGKTVQTPFKDEDGTPKTKPHWQYPELPIRVITDPDEILIIVSSLYDRWPAKPDGELTRRAKDKFDQLPKHSYWQPLWDGTANIFKAKFVVPLGEYVKHAGYMVTYADQSNLPRAHAVGRPNQMAAVKARAIVELDAYIAERSAAGESLTRDDFKFEEKFYFKPDDATDKYIAR